jgi:hypothetical protein
LPEIALFLYEGMTALDAAGVSAGIDMALTLAAHEAGEDIARALQLVIEYDPQPPFDTGSIEKADPDTRELAMETLMAGVKNPIRH